LTKDIYSKTVDRAKGLAILLVVLGHINSPLSGVIFSFHVPFFFFLAGLFIKTSYSEKTYLEKGLKRLIVPFLIFGFLGLFATLIKNVLLHRPIEPLLDSLTGLLYWADSAHMHHYGLVLWFLPALFWSRTIVFLLAKHVRLHPALLIAAATAIAWLAAHFMTLPFCMDKGLVALPWVLIGYVFFRNREFWLSVKSYYVLALILFIALLVYAGGMQRLDLAAKNMGNPLLSIPYTIAVIYLLIWLLHKLDFFSGNWIKSILDVMGQFGRDSMLVLVLHAYTNNAMDIAVNYALGIGYWFVTFIMSSALVYLGILVKKRYTDSLFFRYL
jgi:fucose 4-O-acetylase-like acetyltransferase